MTQTSAFTCPRRGAKRSSGFAVAVYQLSGYWPCRSFANRRFMVRAVRRSDVHQEVFALPWADDLKEFFIFGAFHDGIDAGEIRAKDVMQVAGLVEHVERLAKHAGDIGVARISVALELRVGAGLVHHPQKSASKAGSDAQIGVAIHPGHAVFDPSRLGRRERHADARGPVVARPCEVDRRGVVLDVAAI